MVLGGEQGGFVYLLFFTTYCSLLAGEHGWFWTPCVSKENGSHTCPKQTWRIVNDLLAE